MGKVQFTRREFLVGTASAGLAAQLSADHVRAAARFTRPNVTSAAGQKMLVSYAKGVEAMLALPADDPRNWFRNAFVHMMDCPHGNWWFYVWHRGYTGYLERTVRELSGDRSFALPYWDWTELPQIPDGMFDSVLTPTAKAFEPYTKDLASFTSFIKPALNSYWGRLSASQHMQLDLRGYKDFDALWNDVLAPGRLQDQAFAVTDRARYLSRDNPSLDDRSKYNVSPFVIEAGLRLPTDFHHSQIYYSFTSEKTPSHNTGPTLTTKFSLLEALPHNKVHNFIGGLGSSMPAPYGYMTNNLSPVDPIFFLHHSNMDRLWDVWARKQKHCNRPHLPIGNDLQLFTDEPFLFFVDGDGRYVNEAKAGDFVDIGFFEYDYESGSGEHVALTECYPVAQATDPLVASVNGNTGSVIVPKVHIERHLMAGQTRPLTVILTLTRPDSSSVREFDVLVNAPPGVSQVSVDSPYYAGTVAFYSQMRMLGMAMSMDATVAVPLPTRLQAFSALGTAESSTLTIQVVPSNGAGGRPPTLKALSVMTP